MTEQTPTTSEPLPHISADPAFLAGNQLHADFEMQAEAIRTNPDLSEVAKAEAVASLWEATNHELGSHWQNLQQRRTERAQELNSLLPVGPAIPADASPADTAIIHQTFRSALAEARKADDEGLKAMLADAEKFNDDTMRRAVLTAAIEDGRGNLVKAWTDRKGLTEQMNELHDIQSGGPVLWGLKTAQAFKPIAKPQEVWNLPKLRADRDAAARDAARATEQKRRAIGARTYFG
jgi:hypothetical protein